MKIWIKWRLNTFGKPVKKKKIQIVFIPTSMQAFKMFHLRLESRPIHFYSNIPVLAISIAPSDWCQPILVCALSANCLHQTKKKTMISIKCALFVSSLSNQKWNLTLDKSTKRIFGSQFFKWESIMNLYSCKKTSGIAADGTNKSEIGCIKSGRFNAVLSKFIPSVFWFSWRKIFNNKIDSKYFKYRATARASLFCF